MTIVFTAEIFMSTKGYVARAAELGIVSPPAGTQRSALKQLKAAVRNHLAAAAASGRLKATLKDAGYVGIYETLDRDNRFEPNIWDRQKIELSLPRKLATERKEA
jgi:hypothetical protein